jgi:hypothetical protein
MFPSAKTGPLNAEELEPLSPTARRSRNKSKSGGPGFFGGARRPSLEGPPAYIADPAPAKQKTKAAAEPAHTPTIHAVAVPVDKDLHAHSFGSVLWQQRPPPLDYPTDVQVVLNFKRWSVMNSAGREMLNWYGVIEMCVGTGGGAAAPCSSGERRAAAAAPSSSSGPMRDG